MEQKRKAKIISLGYTQSTWKRRGATLTVVYNNRTSKVVNGFGIADNIFGWDIGLVSSNLMEQGWHEIHRSEVMF